MKTAIPCCMALLLVLLQGSLLAVPEKDDPPPNKRSVFRSGSLSRSTMSLPHFFTPLCRDGQVLVDGGLLDVLDFGVATERRAESEGCELSSRRPHGKDALSPSPKLSASPGLCKDKD